ncbi:MAG: T9SS type A sorting domain-containing protein [Bacteroidetes bacterium]|nr:T9SS type A sorting domain-containing protein [Bacteroidota bacterium]
MKTLALILVAAATFGSQILFAQGCLPEGITFTTQEQIDNFQVNYPGCTEIEGDVLIEGYGISNLAGLNEIQSISGYLKLFYCYGLSDLEGLNSLQTIGGYFAISNLDYLQNLDALESLYSIGGGFSLYWDPDLEDISGLNGLIEVSDINFQLLPALSSIACFQNIDSVNSIHIEACPALVNLNGLGFIQNLSGDLIIKYCDALENLSGLNNLQSIGNDFQLWNNISLSNLDGLNSLEWMGGNLTINENSSLNNISALNNLDSISGELSIYNNENLINLSGFNGLLKVGEGFYIENYPLLSLEGFESLNEIGGDVWIKNNIYLTDLNGLNRLESVGGFFTIESNPDLITLNGLDSLTFVGGDLVFYGNSSLSECAIQSICELLPGFPGNVYIENNAPGCNSVEEVLLACETAIDENKTVELSISPNPAFSFITITSPDDLPIEEVLIYNHFGQKVITTKPVNNTVDVSGLKAGMYLVELSTRDRTERTKFVKN